jgi:hypothetical protein
MTGKMKVKVIKKGTVVKQAEKPAKSAARSKREQAREMVSTVSTWVNDFQARKRDETKIAFEQLFAQPRTQPNES